MNWPTKCADHTIHALQEKKSLLSTMVGQSFIVLGPKGQDRIMVKRPGNIYIVAAISNEWRAQFRKAGMVRSGSETPGLSSGPELPWLNTASMMACMSEPGPRDNLG